jgi:hypothetical protein
MQMPITCFFMQWIRIGYLIIMLYRQAHGTNNENVYFSELHTFFFYIILSINYNNLKLYKVNIKKGKETCTNWGHLPIYSWIKK